MPSFKAAMNDLRAFMAARSSPLSGALSLPDLNLNAREASVAQEQKKKDSFEMILAEQCLNNIAGVQRVIAKHQGVPNLEMAKAIESLSNAVINLYTADALRRDLSGELPEGRNVHSNLEG